MLVKSYSYCQNNYEASYFKGSTFTLPYNILFPVDFQSGKQFPLLLFLHGAGERGSDNQKQLALLHKLFLDAVNSEEYPAIVVFPQCPEDDYWANAKIDRYPDRLDIEFLPNGAPTNALQSVMELMDYLSEMKNVDKNRIYVGGLSMGGMGTFELLSRRPDMFAAAFPICGGGHPATIKPYSDKVKLWVFHGDQDPIVLPKHSKEMVAALQEAGADVKFTLYEGVQHDSWINAREEPDLLPWLFSQRKSAPLKLNSYLTTNAVFQRDQPLRIIGKGQPGQSVEIEWLGRKYYAKIDMQGNLDFQLPAQKAGGPFHLLVSNTDTTIFIQNILVGDVWFASGQSNMRWPLEKAEGGDEEIATADLDQIRFLMAPRRMEFYPVNDWDEQIYWEVGTGEQLSKYSAVAYFFAKKLHSETGIPIGIIDANWGGSIIETWMSDDALRPFEVFDFDLHLLKSKIFPLKETEKRTQATFNTWREKEYKKGIGLELKWYEGQIDLSEWKSLEVPGYWEDQLPEYAEFDGAMWYRRNFDLPKEFLGHDIRIWLGQIADHNICWINGEYIGETYFSKTWTNYLAPKELLEEKDNEIVLRVYNVEGKGGLPGLDTFYDFYPEGNKAKRGRLNGEWMVRPGAKFEPQINESLSISTFSPNDYPTLLFNGMVFPFRNFPVKGVIWYQGESNKINAYFYRQLFPAMIQDWRNLWQSEKMPFYYVQIANYGVVEDEPSDSPSAELRDSQHLTRATPHTGMVVTIDIGDPDDIHPTNKKDVGERLARHALYNEYGQSMIIRDGPVYKSHVRKGKKLIVSFENAEGLQVPNNQAPLAFEIAGKKEEFVKAKARIKNDKIELWHPDVIKPIYIRYAWSESPVVNTTNAENLPMYPFRTDKKRLITQDRIKNFK